MKVARKKDVVEGAPFCALFEGKPIAIFNVGGTFYAIDSTCTHSGGPLCQGTLIGDAVLCPWHGSRFDVKSGEVIRGPADKPVKKYKVQADGEDIEVTE